MKELVWRLPLDLTVIVFYGLFIFYSLRILEPLADALVDLLDLLDLHKGIKMYFWRRKVMKWNRKMSERALVMALADALQVYRDNKLQHREGVYR